MVANDTQVVSRGKGSVAVPMIDCLGEGYMVVFNNVYLVPDQPFSLLSLTQMLDDGWDNPDFP